MAAHPKSDQRRVYLCVDGLRKCAAASLTGKGQVADIALKMHVVAFGLDHSGLLFAASSFPEFIIPMARFMAAETICGANSVPNAPKAYPVRQLANVQITEGISSPLHVFPLMALFTTDWLLRSDIGEVIKTIVDDEAFPDYQIPKKTTKRKKRGR
jgi:hypothetical protein